MGFLPLFFKTDLGSVLLVGSGDPALSKLRLLQAAGAHVRWFPGRPVRAGGALSVGESKLEITPAAPTEADFCDVSVVISAAGDPLDTQVASWARARQIPVNVVDRPELSTFIFPAIVDRGDVVVAIGTGGNAPVLARHIRQQLEALLPARIGDLAAVIGRYRKRVGDAQGHLARRFWESFIGSSASELTLAGCGAEAEQQLIAAIEGSNRLPAALGIVFLVGAGPGDPDLLTLRALQAIAEADVIFYDELVTTGILDRARRDAKRIFVGKRAGQQGAGQDQINRRLVAAARAGHLTVRLKGGDPFVFGRGGEELEYLRARNIPVVVVPGITAALGAAAEAGLPLTFRSEATQLVLVTAHRAEIEAGIDWSGCGDPKTTVVVYMGLSSVDAVRDGLIAAGRHPCTAAAVLARSTRQDAQCKVGRLQDLPVLAASVGKGPALLVIGAAVERSTPWQSLSSRAALADQSVADADPFVESAPIVVASQHGEVRIAGVSRGQARVTADRHRDPPH